MTINEKKIPAALFLLFACLYFFLLGHHGLMEPDEGRYSEIPREMIVTGDWVTPRQNGVLYFEKPVLHYWLTAAAFKALGQNEFASRFWPALLGLLTLPLVFYMGKNIYGHTRAGLLSGCVLGTTLLHFALSRINLTDMTLSFFITLSLMGLWLSQKNRRWLLLFYAAMALALLTKGLVGMVLPCGIAFWYILLTRQWRLIRDYFYIPGILLFFAISIPWFWIVCQRNPDFFHFFFIQEHFLRYTTRIHDRYEPMWFFLPILLAALIPWTGWLPATYRSARAHWKEQKKTTVFLLCWSFVILFFYSLSSSKLIPYILPCLPPLALLIGGAIHTALEEGNKGVLRYGFIGSIFLCLPLALAFLIYPFMQHRIPQEQVIPIGIALALCLLGGALLPLFFLRKNRPMHAVWVQVTAAFLFCLCAVPLFGIIAEDRSAKGLAAFVEKRLYPGDLLAQYATFDQGLPFYLKRRMALVDYKGELAFGAQFPTAKDWFFTREEFEKYRKKRGVLLVMKKRDLDEFFSNGVPEGIITEFYRNYALISYPLEVAP